MFCTCGHHESNHAAGPCDRGKERFDAELNDRVRTHCGCQAFVPKVVADAESLDTLIADVEATALETEPEPETSATADEFVRRATRVRSPKSEE